MIPARPPSPSPPPPSLARRSGRARPEEEEAAAAAAAAELGAPPPAATAPGEGGASGADEEEERPRCCYDWLDEESRIHVLSYLSPADLSEACVVSAQFSRDCFHRSLPAVERAATLVLPPAFGELGGGPGADVERLSRQLRVMASRRSSIGRSLHTLRVVRSPPAPQSEGPPTRRGDAEPAGTATGRRTPAPFVVPGIIGLDLVDVTLKENLVAEALVPHLPDLRHMEVSSLYTTFYMRPFPEARERIRSISYRGGILLHNGHELRTFRRVTDLSLDGSLIDVTTVCSWPPQIVLLTYDGYPEHLFHTCNQPLERVSFRNLTHTRCTSDWRAADPLPMPQRALIKFARRTPTLKWFKSDLTPENVALLRAERPDVTFKSWPDHD